LLIANLSSIQNPKSKIQNSPMSRPTPNTEELINDILARYRRSQQRQQLQERQETRWAYPLCAAGFAILLLLLSSVSPNTWHQLNQKFLNSFQSLCNQSIKAENHEQICRN
jgi:hypothetical protein